MVSQMIVFEKLSPAAGHGPMVSREVNHVITQITQAEPDEKRSEYRRRQEIGQAEVKNYCQGDTENGWHHQAPRVRGIGVVNAVDHKEYSTRPGDPRLVMK